MIEVLGPGAFTSIQDLGRPRYAAVGVPRSGAFDRGALRLANRLVGNAANAAVLEVSFGGLVIRLLDAATVALTGADCGGTLDWGVARSFPLGTVLTLGAPATGVRSYLAVRGGFDAPLTLGSASTDTLSDLGPARLAAGDQLAVGTQHEAQVSGATAIPRPSGTERPFQLFDGPRRDWFTAAARTALVTTTWAVRAESNRIGIRLDGPRLARSGAGELPSEPTRPGALQVSTDGCPILLGPDGPVTGGYPVIGFLTGVELDRAAQLRPGDAITFGRVTGGAIICPRRA